MLRFYSLPESSISSLDYLYVEQHLSSIEKSHFSPFPLVDVSEYSRSKNAIYWNVSPWVENCFGKIVTIPDGICTPLLLEDIKELLQYAEREEAKIIIDWHGKKNPFSNSSKSEKTILLAKLEKLAYIKKIDGSDYKYLLGPGVTAEQLKLYFLKNDISLDRHIDFQGANNIYEFYLNYLNMADENSLFPQNLFLYLRLETASGKFIIEEFDVSANNQKEKIKNLMLTTGSPIGIISGIGVDFSSFIKQSFARDQFVEKDRESNKVDNANFDMATKDEHINFNTAVTMDLLRMEFKLTEREAFVSCLLLEGNGDKAISNKLNISYWTVRTHVNKILEKLAISSRLEIAFKILELYKKTRVQF